MFNAFLLHRLDLIWFCGEVRFLFIYCISHLSSTCNDCEALENDCLSINKHKNPFTEQLWSVKDFNVLNQAALYVPEKNVDAT